MTTYGVFVGLDTYEPDSGLRSLRHAASDAANTRSAFIRNPTGLTSENATLHSEDQRTAPSVTRNSIIAEVNKLRSYPKHGDMLVFYFAGHGFFSEFSGGSGSYLAPSDVKRDDGNRLIPDTAIGVEYIRKFWWNPRQRTCY